MGILVIRISEVTRRAGRALPLYPRFPLNHLVFLWASFKLFLLKRTEVLVQGKSGTTEAAAALASEP